MSIFDTTKKRPNKDTDRFRWNQSWEKDLQDSYRAFARVKNFSPPSNQEASLAQEPHMQLYLLRQTRNTCVLQTDLYNKAVQYIASDGLEGEWMKTTQARKEELALEGLYRASGVGPGMEEFRKWCPEATIAYLAGGGGRNFLDLLKKHIPENIGVELTKPIYIPNASVDRLIDIQPQFRVTAALARLHRSYFLAMVLWRMILAFYGNDESYILTRTPSDQPHQTMEIFRGLMDKDDIREIRRLDKLESKSAVNVCWNCAKDPARLGPGKELKACVKCKEIRRIIRYCSRECQKNDWKNGKPVPHKAICGKPMMDVDPPEKEAVGAGSDDDRIPPPDPGFKRSMGLSYQITQLRRMPQCDYVLDLPPPNKNNKSITLVDPLTKELFHFARNQAFKNGDPRAVCIIFQLLKSMMSESDVEILTHQLEREYGIDLANAGD